MNLIEQTLSSMKKGTPVRLTQTNGQTIEGTLTENDGSASLSIQISCVATIRYSQIAAIQTCGGTAVAAIPEPVVIAEQPTMPVTTGSAQEKQAKEDMYLSCSENDVRFAFKEMDGDSRRLLNPVFSKIQSAIKGHEDSKFHEAAELCWKLMQDNNLENDPEVNQFYGYVCFLNGEYLNSSISFFYAGDIRSAYRAAFYGAEMDSLKELYLDSAAFSAIYLANKPAEYSGEALHVLMISSEKRSDITGLQYLFSSDPDSALLLKDAFMYLGEKCGIHAMDYSNPDECIAKLKPRYSAVGIFDEIRKLLSETNQHTDDTTVSDTENELSGTMATYSILDRRGVIRTDDGKEYVYDINDINDAELMKKLGKLKSKKDFSPVDVLFVPSRKNSKDSASGIVCKYADEVSEQPEITSYSEYSANSQACFYSGKDPNKLITAGKYEEAIEILRDKLDSSGPDDALAGIIQCYMSLWNKNDDMGYSSEISALISRYADDVHKSSKCLEMVQQYYMKVHNYSGCLEILNELIENTDHTDNSRRLHYIQIKERCYRGLHDYGSAIGQLNDWLDIVDRNKLNSRNLTRQTIIYIELAELYFEVGDYENAEKFLKKSTCSQERKQILLDRLNAIRQPEEQPESDSYDDDYDESPEPGTAITLQEAYAEYSDNDTITISDEDVVAKLSTFDENQLYCLLTWLTAADRLSGKNIVPNDSALSGDFTVTQAIHAIKDAFSYAYNNPLSECDYTSSQIIDVYDNARKLIPQYSDDLMISAVLRTMFSPSATDYNLDSLIKMVENSYTAARYPTLISLLNKMKEFYESTGYALDLFAGYRSNNNVIGAIIAEAVKLQDSCDAKNDVYENQGQVRRMRELIFSDEQCELRRCLDIVAENNAAEIKYVRSVMEKQFIRSGKPLSADHIDPDKLDDFIDFYWKKSRDLILAEGRHVARPHDKLKGSKKNNVDSSIKKIISCVCDWLAVAEHSANHEEEYIKQRYTEAEPELIAMFRELSDAVQAETAESGFDWGRDSLRRTTEEFLSKLCGTYNSRARKYFFIDFLRGEEVLLDDDYLPELTSTFCGWGRMNILDRIERHTSENHPALSQRIAEIISDDETRHNFRSARLIKAYAEDTGDAELAECKEFALINACLNQAKKRFGSMYQDFSNEIGLYETYGTISDTNGEKTSVLNLALAWYKITRITNDFGFYAKLLDAIKHSISDNAAGLGKALMRQLEDLADKPEYDFGVYPREMIEELIAEQNYASAEQILNCIRRKDTKQVTNYSIEPFSYFSDFVNENSLNYRVVCGADTNIVEKIYKYYGKKDLDRVLGELTNNARKETKGGAELLRAWPKTNNVQISDLTKLLTRLGFNPESVTPENTDSGIKSYKVICHKRSGKVTYPHCIPAFGSLTETEGFRVACLFGKFDCNSLMNSFRLMNTAAKHTIVLLDYALNMEERRRLARKIKEEKSFSKTFIVIDRIVAFYLAKHYAADTVSKRLMAVTLPFAYYQPFVEASTQTMPVELFTGREAELTSIESPEGANLVYGGRQLGKSALLKMAQHNIDKNGNGDRAVLLDIQYKNYTEAAELLSRELIARGILSEGCECDNWDTLALHIKKRLMDENPDTRINYLLIMLDEADEFIRTSAEDDNPPIAAVKNLPANRFKLVMAGLHNLSRFNREMLQGNSNLIHLSSVVIKQFQRPEAIKLLTNTLAYLGFRFDDKVISLILAKTNYYPGLIQFYCQKLLEAMKDSDYAGYSESNTPYYEVNEDHIKKVLSDSTFMNKVNEKLEASLFTEEKGHSQYHIIALIFAFLCYESPAEKKYTIDDLMNVAEEYKITRLLVLSREQTEELLSEMCDLNILSVEDGYYRFATEGFRELLGSREQVENSMSEYFEEGRA